MSSSSGAGGGGGGGAPRRPNPIATSSSTAAGAATPASTQRSSSLSATTTAAATAAAATPTSAASSSSSAAAAAAAVAAKLQQQQFSGTTLPPMSLPPPGGAVVDPNSIAQHLAPLKDDTSAYAGVTKACLHLTNNLTTLSSADISEAETVASSQLWHEPSYADTVSQCFAALIECLQCHKDRRCRVLACTTLGLVGKSAYSRIRPTPLLYASRENSRRNDRLQDEICGEVPSALVNASLNDTDDGVSATAVQALGILTLTSSTTNVAQPLPDALWYHVQAMAFIRPSPYAPSLSYVTDEDPSIPQEELSRRVIQNIVAPRMVQLLDRVLAYGSNNHISLSIPFLTKCWIHQIQTCPAAIFNMSLQTFAKRWSEVDAVALVDIAVTSLLLPAVQQSTMSGNLEHAAAFSLIRLASVSPNRPWVKDACVWAARCLQEELQSTAAVTGSNNNTEQTLVTLSALIVALRGVPVVERHATLQWMAGIIAALPSTISAPFGISCAGAVVEFAGLKQYRRPARIALWTELALSYFVDGPGGVSGYDLKEAHRETAPLQANAPPAPLPLRHELLQYFLTTGTVGRIITDTKSRVPGAVLPVYDEILLAFATTASDSGRRFRVMADGTILLVDPEAPEVLEWVRLAHAVLTAFCGCINVGTSTSTSNTVGEFSLLDSADNDDCSLLTAAQASYLRLLQEYLYFVGLIYPDSSVAFKLTPNACPHILWMQMSESGSILSKLEAVDMNEEETAAALMDELVSRELQQGVRSHPLRMYLLTLAADSWIQGRMLNVRNQMEMPEGEPVNHANLKVQSARDILYGLSPKRLLTKLMESASPGGYAPEQDGKKQKKDPVKKLAPEVLKASAACIEGIALTACDWRRRFGSSQESKQIVSIAVGLLQGKVDNSETPTQDDKTMRALMGPICDAAVSRIQAFYESESGGAADPTFPVSELVAQHVKLKIKPLITAAKPPNVSKDKFSRSYFMLLCRQIVTSRIEQCVYSAPPADSLLASARPTTNWLRLSGTIGPFVGPQSRDARLLDSHYGGNALAAWGTSVHLSSAASDAVALITAFTPRRYVRHDGEDEYRCAILMRAFNTTPIPLLEGLRLEVGVYQKAPDPNDMQDPTSLEVVESLGGNVGALMPQEPLASAIASYRQEINGGDFITWEVSLDQLSPAVRNAVVMPSVVYRNVKVEPIELVAKWVGDKSNTSGDASTQISGSAESKSGEDDFQVTATSSGGDPTGKGGVGTDDSSMTDRVKILPGEPLNLSPMVGLQPCPLVFFCDAWGDATTFRLLWFQMSYHVSPLRISTLTTREDQDDIAFPVDREVSKMACLKNFHGEAVPNGVATKLWAFSSLSGGHVLCILAETNGSGGKNTVNTPTTHTLHFRGDDNALLYSLTGPKSSRAAVIAALCPGMGPCN